MSLSLIALDPSLANIIQDGTIERLVHDALISETLFRMGVRAEKWTPHQGETLNMMRDGLLPVSITPQTPGVDPTPLSRSKETWQAQLRPYGNTIDHYLPHNYIANIPQFMQDMKALGVNCGETIDTLIRSRLFRGYLGGNTVVTVLAAIGATTIHVASGNGFGVVNDANGIPQTVSSSNPLTISFGGAEPTNTVILVAPDDPVNDPDGNGPCTLTLGAALTVGLAAREAVLAANRSRMFFAGGGNSIDFIGAGDTLSFADLVNAVTYLRSAPTVPTHPGGLYHCHLNPYAEGQLLRDAEVRGLIQASTIPDEYATYRLGTLSGCTLYRNARCPDANNVGTLVSTGAGSSQGSSQIGGEVRNNAGIYIGYTIITGQGYMYEKYVPPMATQDQLPAGAATHQQSPIRAESGAVMLNTDRCKLIIRPPQDRNNELVALTWNFKGDFPLPSDITTSSARYMRAAIIAHAIPLA